MKLREGDLRTILDWAAVVALIALLLILAPEAEAEVGVLSLYPGIGSDAHYKHDKLFGGREFPTPRLRRPQKRRTMPEIETKPARFCGSHWSRLLCHTHCTR